MNPQPWHRRRGAWTALAVGLALLAIFHFWEFYASLRLDLIPPGGLFLQFITGPVFFLAAAMVWAHRPASLPPNHGGYLEPPLREYQDGAR